MNLGHSATQRAYAIAFALARAAAVRRPGSNPEHKAQTVEREREDKNHGTGERPGACSKRCPGKIAAGQA